MFIGAKGIVQHQRLIFGIDDLHIKIEINKFNINIRSCIT
jgi:hypothetical protein